MHVLSFLPVASLALAASVDRRCYRLQTEALKSCRSRVDLSSPDAWLIDTAGQIETPIEERTKIYTVQMEAVCSQKHLAFHTGEYYDMPQPPDENEDFQIGHALRLTPDESLLIAIGAVSPKLTAASEAAAAATAAWREGPWGPWIRTEEEQEGEICSFFRNTVTGEKRDFHDGEKPAEWTAANEARATAQRAVQAISGNKGATLYRPTDLSVVGTLSHEATVVSVALSVEHIALGGSNGVVRTFDAATHAPLGTLPDHHGGGPMSLAIQDDLLVTGAADSKECARDSTPDPPPGIWEDGPPPHAM